LDLHIFKMRAQCLVRRLRRDDERGLRLLTQGSSWLRALALLAALGIVLVALWGMLLAMLVGGISAQAPDPFIPSGDPCCGHPDTWGEVGWGFVGTLGYVLADSLLWCLAAALISWAMTERWPRLKKLTMLPSGALLTAIVVFAVVLVPQLDEARTPPDCDTFTFTRSAWRSSDEEIEAVA